MPPEYFRENAQEDFPDSSEKEQSKGKGKGKQPENDDPSRRESDGAAQTSTPRIDPEEQVESRYSKTNRQLTDEVGRYPEGLGGVKPEDPPGSQNQIILGPRLPLINVSQAWSPFSPACWRDPLTPGSITNKK